jgi:hypothetical protein
MVVICAPLIIYIIAMVVGNSPNIFMLVFCLLIQGVVVLYSVFYFIRVIGLWKMIIENKNYAALTWVIIPTIFVIFPMQ